MLSTLLLVLLPPLGRSFFRWVRASAPTGCSPRDSGRLLAIGSDLHVFISLSNSHAFLNRGASPPAGAPVPLLGVVPEILAEVTNRIRHLFSLLVAFLNRETFLPVGARKRTHWV